jgi:hypothetical protein
LEAGAMPELKVASGGVLKYKDRDHQNFEEDGGRRAARQFDVLG